MWQTNLIRIPEVCAHSLVRKNVETVWIIDYLSAFE